jgi:uncharacterized protein (TIRG00374 family)
MSGEPPPRGRRLKRWAVFLLRWGIAVIGIWLVVNNINLRDHVIYENDAHQAIEATVISTSGAPGSESFVVEGLADPIPRSRLLMPADRKHVRRASDGRQLEVIAVSPLADARASSTPSQVWVSENARGLLDRWVFRTLPGPFSPVSPATLEGGYRVEAEFPLVEIGLRRMLHEANTGWLLLSVGVIPLVYLITGYRWWLLLEAVGSTISLWLAMQINMVGAFYNTFMPGSTGGDVLKAYYAAKNTPNHRTQAVLSVVVDRAIGLLALIMMGGVAAACQWQVERCRQVAMASAAIVGALALGIVLLGVTPIRKGLGLHALLRRLPMREKLSKVAGALRSYRSRPGLMLGTLAMSFPVHATVVVSALFAGWAFGLPLRWEYYWVVVPTVVLAGALPLSPQGAGVMEFFAILLTRPQGVTVGQAVALTLSIRLVQIVWNLVGGALVFFGDYHAPTAAEEKAMEGEDNAATAS